MSASKPTSWSGQDRRRGPDRRQRDAGPPRGVRERRTHCEARQPQIEELEMSLEDFQALMAQSTGPTVDVSIADMAAARAQVARDRHRN